MNEQNVEKEASQEGLAQEGLITIKLLFLPGGKVTSTIDYGDIDPVSAGIVLVDLGRNLLVEAARHQHQHQH